MTKNKTGRPLGHQEQIAEAERLLERDTQEVVLEAGRGPVNGSKIRMAKQLWTKIKQLARPYPLTDERVLPRDAAARFIEALVVNAPAAKAWPEEEQATLRQVFALLYQHDGLVISEL